MTLKEKLLKIQVELKAPKNQVNKFGGYNYRSCEDILEAVKPIADKYKAVVTVTDMVVLVGERYYIEATATLFDCESDERHTVSAYAREEEIKKGMDASQITGSASSYARKYALNGLFAIDDTKDADTRDNSTKESKEPKTEPTITASQIDIIKSKMSEERIAKMLEYYKVESIEQLTLKQASETCKKLK